MSATIETASQGYTVHYEGGEQVFPCRCGETHRGAHAIYDYGHHNCFHDAGLIRIADDVPDYLVCPSCGKHFWIVAAVCEGTPNKDAP